MKNKKLTLFSLGCIAIFSMNNLAFSQKKTSSIEVYDVRTYNQKRLHKKHIPKSLEAVEYNALIPELDTNYVPQGIAYIPNTSHVIISYYSHHKIQKPSRLIVVDTQKQKRDGGPYDQTSVIAVFDLYNNKKDPFKGHTGGIAIAGDYLWAASFYLSG